MALDTHFPAGVTVFMWRLVFCGNNWIQQYTDMNKQPCVYLLSSQRNGTLYIGVTSHLVKRVYQHRTDAVEGFTKQYAVHTLVWYEVHEMMESAILREKQLKKRSRIAKIRLIETQNPEWVDLWPSLVSPSVASGSRQSMPG